MRIAIATAGRFHVLDLARELERLGHDVRFYSYVPRARARGFGLKDECQVSLLPYALPMLIWERLAPDLWPRARERCLRAALNCAVILRLQPGDVFICMSGVYLEAARHAKTSFGARIWLERGSRHILSQDEILAAIPGAQRPSADTISRELCGYDLADRIVIPSSHVGESFQRAPAAYAKLFRNPYGVDLSMFPATAHQRNGAVFTALCVGSWCLRKGCDVLAAAIRQNPGVRLVHVGELGDLAFPSDADQFIHYDPVPQNHLKQHYAQADIFVLASLEEGLSVVQAQALASGLPLICTDRTGGADLAHTPSLAERIMVVPHGDIDALAMAIANLRCRLEAGGMPPITEADRQTLSWAAYAARYNDELIS